MSKREPPPIDPRGPATWPVRALLLLVSAVTCALPGPVAYGLASCILAPPIALLVLLRERKLNARRRGVQRNMRLAFGALEPPALRRLTWAYARHAAALGVDLLRLPLLTGRRVRARVAGVEDLDATYRALLARGKGVICATGHFGNWEVLGHMAGLIGLPVTSIARPCPEPGLQRWLLERRQEGGQQVLSKYGGLWPLKKALGRGGVVGLNMDENTRERAVFVPFCGVLAASNQSAYQLQRLTGAPIAVTTLHRVGPDRYRVHVWSVVEPDRTVPADVEQARVTREVMRGFEQALAAYPAQWLWSLRRWETRPPGEPEGEPARVEPALRLEAPRGA